jgi:hypothetical protein
MQLFGSDVFDARSTRTGQMFQRAHEHVQIEVQTLGHICWRKMRQTKLANARRM